MKSYLNIINQEPELVKPYLGRFRLISLP